MKLIAILGSPHGMKGSTGTLLDGVLHGARAAGAEVEIFSLSELQVQPCRGCDVCHRKGDCIIDDDFTRIRQAFEQADGLILGSPNYIVSVSAQLKALLDRCSPLLHLQSISNKYAAAVVTSGGPGSEEVEQYLLRFLRSLGYATVGSVGALGWQMQVPGKKEPNLEKAAVLGKQLVEAISTRQSFPEQAAERQAMIERMKHLITSQKERWPYEYEYWVMNHGC